MSTTKTTVSSVWQKVADAGDNYVLQAQGTGQIRVQLKATLPTDDLGFLIRHGQGLTQEYGEATDNCYVKMAETGTAVVVVTTAT